MLTGEKQLLKKMQKERTGTTSTTTTTKTGRKAKRTTTTKTMPHHPAEASDDASSLCSFSSAMSSFSTASASSKSRHVSAACNAKKSLRKRAAKRAAVVATSPRNTTTTTTTTTPSFMKSTISSSSSSYSSSKSGARATPARSSSSTVATTKSSPTDEEKEQRRDDDDSNSSRGGPRIRQLISFYSTRSNGSSSSVSSNSTKGKVEAESRDDDNSNSAREEGSTKSNRESRTSSVQQSSNRQETELEATVPPKPGNHHVNATTKSDKISRPITNKKATKSSSSRMYTSWVPPKKVPQTKAIASHKPAVEIPTTATQDQVASPSNMSSITVLTDERSRRVKRSSSANANQVTSPSNMSSNTVLTDERSRRVKRSSSANEVISPSNMSSKTVLTDERSQSKPSLYAKKKNFNKTITANSSTESKKKISLDSDIESSPSSTNEVGGSHSISDEDSSQHTSTSTTSAHSTESTNNDSLSISTSETNNNDGIKSSSMRIRRMREQNRLLLEQAKKRMGEAISSRPAVTATESVTATFATEIVNSSSGKDETMNNNYEMIAKDMQVKNSQLENENDRLKSELDIALKKTLLPFHDCDVDPNNNDSNVVMDKIKSQNNFIESEAVQLKDDVESLKNIIMDYYETAGGSAAVGNDDNTDNAEAISSEIRDDRKEGQQVDDSSNEPVFDSRGISYVENGNIVSLPKNVLRLAPFHSEIHLHRIRSLEDRLVEQQENFTVRESQYRELSKQALRETQIAARRISVLQKENKVLKVKRRLHVGLGLNRIIKLENDRDAMEKSKTGLEGITTLQKKVISKLKDTVDDLLGTNQDLEASRATLGLHAGIFQNRVFKLENRSAMLEARILHANNINIEQSDSISTMKQVIDNLEHRNSRLEEEKENLCSERVEQIDSMSAFKQEISNLQSRNSELEQEKENLCSEHQLILEEESESRRDQVQALECQLEEAKRNESILLDKIATQKAMFSLKTTTEFQGKIDAQLTDDTPATTVSQVSVSNLQRLRVVVKTVLGEIRKKESCEKSTELSMPNLITEITGASSPLDSALEPSRSDDRSTSSNDASDIPLELDALQRELESLKIAFTNKSFDVSSVDTMFYRNEKEQKPISCAYHAKSQDCSSVSTSGSSITGQSTTSLTKCPPSDQLDPNHSYGYKSDVFSGIEDDDIESVDPIFEMKSCNDTVDSEAIQRNKNGSRGLPELQREQNFEARISSTQSTASDTSRSTAISMLSTGSSVLKSVESGSKSDDEVETSLTINNSGEEAPNDTPVENNARNLEVLSAAQELERARGELTVLRKELKELRHASHPIGEFEAESPWVPSAAIELDEAREELTALREELKGLRKVSRDLDRERDHLSDDRNRLVKQVKSQSVALKSAKNSLQKSIARETALCAHLSQLVTSESLPRNTPEYPPPVIEVDNSQEVIDELRGLNKNLDKANRSLHMEKESLMMEAIRESEVVTDLEIKLEEGMVRESSLRKELDALNEEACQQREKINHLTADLKEATNQAGLLWKSRESLIVQSRLQVEKVASLEQHVEGLINRETLLRTGRDSIMNKVSEQEGNFQQEIAEAAFREKRLLQELEFARREVERTKDHAAAMENEISVLHNSLSAARNRTATATTELDNLKDSMNLLNEEKKQIFARWEAAEQDAETKTKEVEALEGRLENALELSSTLQRDLGNAKREAASANQAVEDANRQTEELRKDIETNEQDRETARQMIQLLGLELMGIRETNSSLDASKAFLEDEINASRSRESKQLKAMSILDEKLNSSMSRESALRKQHKQVNQKLSVLKKKADVYAKEMENSLSASKKELAASRGLIDSLGIEMSQLRKVIQDFEVEGMKANKERRELQCQVEQHRATLYNAHAAFKNKLGELFAREALLRKEVGQWKEFAEREKHLRQAANCNSESLVTCDQTRILKSLSLCQADDDEASQDPVEIMVKENPDLRSANDVLRGQLDLGFPESDLSNRVEDATESTELQDSAVNQNKCLETAQHCMAALAEKIEELAIVNKRLMEEKKLLSSRHLTTVVQNIDTQSNMFDEGQQDVQLVSKKLDETTNEFGPQRAIMPENSRSAPVSCTQIAGTRYTMARALNSMYFVTNNFGALQVLRALNLNSRVYSMFRLGNLKCRTFMGNGQQVHTPIPTTQNSCTLTTTSTMLGSGKIVDFLDYLLTGKQCLVKDMLNPTESGPSITQSAATDSLSCLPRILCKVTTDSSNIMPASSYVSQNERTLFTRKMALLEDMILHSLKRESMMEQRISDATNLVSIAQRKTDQQQEQAHANREHLRSVEITNRELDRINRKLEDRVVAIMDERNKATEHIDLVEAKLSNANAELQSMRQEVAGKADMVRSLEDNLDSSQGYASVMASCKSELEAKCRALEESNLTCCGEKRVLEARLSQIEAHSRQSEQLADSLQKQLASSEMELEQITVNGMEEKRIMEEAVQQLQEKATSAELEISKYVTLCDKLTLEADIWKLDSAKLANDKMILEVQVEDLKKKVPSLRMEQRARAELLTIQERAQVAETQLQGTRNDLYALIKQYSGLQETHRSLVDKDAITRKQRNNLQNQVADLTNKLREASERAACAEERLDEVDKAMHISSDTDRGISSLEDEKSLFDARIRQMKSDHDRNVSELQEKIQLQNIKLNELISQEEAARQQLSAVESDAAKASERAIEIENARQILEKRLCIITSDRDEFRQKYQNLDEALANIHKERKSLQEKVSSLEETLLTSVIDACDFSSAICEKHHQLDGVKRATFPNLLDKAGEISHSGSDANFTACQSDSTDETYHGTLLNKEEEGTPFENSKCQSTEADDAYETLKRRAKRRVKQLKIEKLKAQKELETVRELADAAEGKLIQRETEVRCLQNEVSVLEGRETGMTSRELQLEKELDSSKTELKALTMSRDTLIFQKRQLEEKLARVTLEAEGHVKNLEDSLRLHKEEAEEDKDRASLREQELVSQFEDVKGALTAAIEELKLLESRLAEAALRESELEKELLRANGEAAFVRKEASELKAQMNQANDTISIVNEDKKLLENQLVEESTSKELLEQDFSKAKLEIGSLKAQESELKESLQQANDGIRDFAENKKILEQHLVDAAKRETKLEEEVSNLKLKVESVHSEARGLRELLTEQQQLSGAALSKQALLQRHLSLMTSRMDITKSEADQRALKLQESNDELQNRSAESIAKQVELQKELLRTKAALEKARKSTSELRERFFNLGMQQKSASASVREEMLQNALVKASSELNSVRSGQRMTRNYLQKLQDDFDSIRKRSVVAVDPDLVEKKTCANLDDSNRQMEDAMDQLFKSVKDVRKMLRDEKQSRQKASEETRQARKQLKSMEQSLLTQQTELASTCQCIENLADELDDLRKENDNLLRQNKEAVLRSLVQHRRIEFLENQVESDCVNEASGDCSWAGDTNRSVPEEVSSVPTEPEPTSGFELQLDEAPSDEELDSQPDPSSCDSSESSLDDFQESRQEAGSSDESDCFQESRQELGSSDESDCFHESLRDESNDNARNRNTVTVDSDEFSIREAAIQALKLSRLQATAAEVSPTQHQWELHNDISQYLNRKRTPRDTKKMRRVQFNDQVEYEKYPDMTLQWTKIDTPANPVQEQASYYDNGALIAAKGYDISSEGPRDPDGAFVARPCTESVPGKSDSNRSSSRRSESERTKVNDDEVWNLLTNLKSSHTKLSQKLEHFKETKQWSPEDEVGDLALVPSTLPATQEARENDETNNQLQLVLVEGNNYANNQLQLALVDGHRRRPLLAAVYGSLIKEYLMFHRKLNKSQREQPYS